MVTDKSAWFHPTPAGHARLADDVAAYLSGGTGLGTAALEVAMPWTPRNLPLGIPTSQQARTWLGGLPMAMAATTPYDREMQFGSKWRQIKKCNTRQDILRRDALRSRQHPPVALVPASAGSPITEGSWETPYEDSPTVFSSKIKNDIHDNLGIDHIVPFENAWNSGAAFAPWDDKMRRDLANDEYRPQLLTVSKSTNSSKMEKSPDQWMPPNTGLWCTYDDMWSPLRSTGNSA